MRGYVEKLSQFLLTWASSLRMQLGAVAASYALGVDIFLGLRFIVGEQLVIVAAFNNGLQWLLSLNLLALLGILLFATDYKWFWVIYAVPGIIVFGVWYAPYLLPKTPPDLAENAVTFSVATFNIAQIYSDGRVQVMDDLDADILGLQELWSPQVIEYLGEKYPYSATTADAKLYLYSRYPIREDETVVIDDPEQLSRPVAQRSVVTINDQNVSVYVMHPVRPEALIRPLKYDGSERKIGIDLVGEHIAAEENPVLILCDCNLFQGTEDYETLAGLLKDTWREIGWGFGWTSPASSHSYLMFARADYIWHSEAIQPVKIEVWSDAGGSDHRPVRAEMILDVAE